MMTSQLFCTEFRLRNHNFDFDFYRTAQLQPKPEERWPGRFLRQHRPDWQTSKVQKGPLERYSFWISMACQLYFSHRSPGKGQDGNPSWSGLRFR